MKRFMITLAFILIGASFFSACGKEKAEPAQAGSQISKEEQHFAQDDSVIYIGSLDDYHELCANLDLYRGRTVSVTGTIQSWSDVVQEETQEVIGEKFYVEISTVDGPLVNARVYCYVYASNKSIRAWCENEPSGIKAGSIITVKGTYESKLDNIPALIGNAEGEVTTMNG